MGGSVVAHPELPAAKHDTEIRVEARRCLGAVEITAREVPVRRANARGKGTLRLEGKVPSSNAGDVIEQDIDFTAGRTSSASTIYVVAVTADTAI